MFAVTLSLEANRKCAILLLHLVFCFLMGAEDEEIWAVDLLVTATFPCADCVGSFRLIRVLLGNFFLNSHLPLKLHKKCFLSRRAV